MSAFDPKRTHYVAIRGVAFPAIDAFETPLGHVLVDHDGFNEIMGLPFVSRNEAAHAPEAPLASWALLRI
jgi:AmmeMemoRadiSam system protein B